MDSPTDPHNVDPDDDVLRFLDDYCPSPLIHPPVDPPPSPIMFTAAASAENVIDNGFAFDINVDEIMNFGSDHDHTAEGGEAAPAKNDEAGPSGTKELGFQWALPSALDCAACTGASELCDYSNGLYNMRLSVHTVAGNLNHLVFDVEATDIEISSGVDTYFMNFECQSLELINASLAKYAIKIEENGPITLLNSFIGVYNLILEKQVVMAHQGGGSTSSQQTSDSNDGYETPDIEEGVGNPADEEMSAGPLDLMNLWVTGPGEASGATVIADNDGALMQPPAQRPSVGVQRERTANMCISDLVPYFHMKADDAARMLNICPTTLKILCRKLELGRWPHRKVKSIENRIKRLNKQMREKAEARDMQAISGLQDEIVKEEEKKIRLYEHLTRDRV